VVHWPPFYYLMFVSSYSAAFVCSACLLSILPAVEDSKQPDFRYTVGFYFRHCKPYLNYFTLRKCKCTVCKQRQSSISDSWFRASWFNVNKKIQLDATVRRHLFTAKSLYMFRASQRQSPGVLKTVTATSGIGHNTGTGSSCASIMTYTRGSGYSF